MEAALISLIEIEIRISKGRRNVKDVFDLLLMLADDGQDDKEYQANGDGDEQDKEGRHQMVEIWELKNKLYSKNFISVLVMMRYLVVS